jgi:hypothetical protein
MVNLKALEAALNKVEHVRHHELAFEVNGQKITLRILRPGEEAEVQKYAQVALEHVEPNGPPDQGAYMDLMNRMRQATLGYSIVQLNDINLRGVEYLETGELDEHNNPISVPKWEAICGLVADWGQHMLSEVSKRYGDLVDLVEIQADKSVKFDPIDLDTEIDRVAKRLKDLQAAKTKRDGQVVGGPIPDFQPGEEPPQPSQAPKVTRATENMVEQPPEPQQPPAPQPQPAPSQQPQGRRSALPQSAPPPQRAPQQAAPQQPQQPQQGPQVEYDERGRPMPDGGDSFFDPSDPGRALEVENRRLAMMRAEQVARERAKAQQDQMRREMGMPTEQELAQQVMERNRESARPNAVDMSKVGGAAAGVRQAANLHNAVFDGQAGSVQPGRPGRGARPQPGAQGKPATLHGKPVYKMQPQTLDRPEAQQRQHGEDAPGPMQLNRPAGGRNPNFRPKGS